MRSKVSASGKATRFVGVILFVFLLLQTLFFYQTSVYLQENNATPQAKEPCNELPIDSLPCRDLSERQCDFRADCFAIRGHRCGGIIGQETFLQCIPNYEARITKKMQLDPRLPTWSYGHPDMKSICAHNGNQQAYRFDELAPSDWTQIPCYNCSIHPPEIPISRKQTGLSLVALVHREFDSFENAVRSWKRSGLLDYADETILWINQRTPVQDPIYDLAIEFGLTVISSEINLGIGPAVSELVLAAKNPLVIFLEKDWEVVEPNEVVVKELEYAKRLVLSNVNGSRADAVKLRSRWNAGFPNIDKKLCIPPDYDNEELNDYAQFRWFEELNDYQWWLPHLFCNIYHYESDVELLSKYPNRIWKCGDALCFDSAQCGWTNNPILFKKHWFLDTLYGLSQQEDNPTFEGGTYYSREWVEPHWVIGETEGFFKHHEINEHM